MNSSKVLPLLTLAMLLLLCQEAEAKKIEKREIQVGLAIGSSFKTIPGWKEKFKKRLAYASQIFEREFKVKLRPAAFWDWKPQSENRDTQYLLANLREAFPLHGVDMVIGLTRLSSLPDTGQINDIHVLGRARPFSGYMVIRYPNNPLFRVQEETVLVHELGHLFGAIHVDDPESIMSPVVEKQIPTRFDRTNRDIVSLTRDVDFKMGLNILDAKTNQQLIGSYMKMMVQNQPLEFYYMLGVFYLNMGKTSDAIDAWERATDLDEKNPQIRYDLGALYYKLGYYKEAAKELTKAISGFNKPWQRPQKAAALNFMGETYLKRGKLLLAYNAFSRAAAILPDDLDIKVNLAMVQLKRGQPKTAIRELKRLVRADPYNAKIWGMLGSAYSETGEYQEAVGSLKKALQVLNERGNPKTQNKLLFDIYTNLGKILLKVGQVDQALASYQSGCQVYPSLDCYEQMGNFYFTAKRWEEAVQQYATVLQQKKNNADIYGRMGVAFSQMGENQKALSVFQEGLNHIDEPAAVSKLHSNIGHLYLQSRHPDLAEKEFRMSITKDWQNVDGHIGLAMAYLKKNNPAGSKSSLKTALRLNPGHTQAKKLLADVEKLLEAQQNQTVRIQLRGRSAG